MEDLGEVISEGVEGAEYRATHNHPELQETQPVDAEWRLGEGQDVVEEKVAEVSHRVVNSDLLGEDSDAVEEGGQEFSLRKEEDDAPDDEGEDDAVVLETAIVDCEKSPVEETEAERAHVVSHSVRGEGVGGAVVLGEAEEGEQTEEVDEVSGDDGEAHENEEAEGLVEDAREGEVGMGEPR